MAEKRYSLPPYTEGWFQMGWSDDLPVGAVKQLHHFGRTYVMFRAASGEVSILDDICPHLGAHLSQGGCVRGRSIVCPYHAWAFDGDGRCVDIPYAKKIPVKARTTSHAVVERYGMIFMYRNHAGTAPTYDLPTMDDFDPATYSRPETFDFEVRIHGQDIMENSVDSAHFAAVHGHAMPTNEFRQEGRELRITQRTKVQRFGTTLHARLEFHMIEPGFHYLHFPEMPGLPAHVFSSIVPVDGERVRHRLSIRIKRSRIPGFSELTRRFLVWQMMKTYREDMKIWETKEYLPRPVLCDGDGAIIKLRSWYKMFFDPEPEAAPRRHLDLVSAESGAS